MTNTDLFYKDLSTFSKKDLHTLFRYYHVSSISQLIPKITKKASIPSGTIFSALDDNNFDDFMEFLNDPNFDPDDRAILINCVMKTKKYGEKYIIELLKKNPNLNLQNPDGKTALIMAARFSNRYSTEETVKILVAAGANLNIQDNNGNTALMLASGYSNTDSTEETVQILIKAGANLNLKNNDGMTALMMASRFSGIDNPSTEGTVKMLVAAGTDLNIQNNLGQTALILASRNTSEEEVKILVDGPPGGPGTDLNIQNDDGRTALMMASGYNTAKVVKILVKAGANLNLQDNDGRTALMLASQSVDPDEKVKILLDAGADINLENNDGKTAIELANNVDTQLLLLDKGAKLTDSQNLKDIVKIKIREIRIELEKYKNKLSDLELELLKCDEGHKKSGIEEIKNLQDCVKKAKEMKRYRPGEGGALKLEKKYNKHSYFNKV